MQSDEPFQRVRISSQFSYLRSYTPINYNRNRTFSELIEEYLVFTETIMENYPTSNITPNFIQEIIISCCPFDISKEELYCYICMDIKNDFEICLFSCENNENNIQTSNCSGHKICQTCLKEHIKTSNLCPLCRKIITKITTQNDEIKQLFTVS
jgi:hypothetical protein